MRLTTDRLDLRPFTAGDIDAMLSWHSHPDAVRYLYWEPMSRPRVLEMLHRKIGHTDIRAEGDGVNFAVVRRADNAVLGETNLQLQSSEHRCAEIGYIFHPDHHGHGYATETAREMLRLGFEHYDAHRIIGRVDAANVASAKVLERLGMRREALFIDNEFVKGAWTSEAIYAMLVDEWSRLTGPAGRDAAIPTVSS